MKTMKELPIVSLAIDPVCGMKVDPSRAAGTHAHGGQNYFFCCRGCLDKFKADPLKYLERQSPPALIQIGGLQQLSNVQPPKTTPPAATGTGYTCPMDPEVRQNGPGVCPKCGMALEPEIATEDEGPNPELVDMTRRFWIATVLSLPVLVLGMMEAGRWIQFALATPVVIAMGAPVFARGWKSLVNRSLNMFTLIATGVGTAYGYSVLAMLVPRIFPEAGSAGQLPVYFEAAAVITTLVLLGQVLELRARAKTSSAIKALLGLAPKTARRIEADGVERDVPLEDVRVGQMLRVRPGEKVPIDAIVVDGTSSVDESMVSGEAIPVEKTSGELVIGGTINGSGTLVVQAERVGRDTLLAQIVQMVGQAQRSRAPVQRLADTVSAWFVPAVIVVAAVTFAVWMFAGPEPRLCLR